jgi:hypothetical protein
VRDTAPHFNFWYVREQIFHPGGRSRRVKLRLSLGRGGGTGADALEAEAWRRAVDGVPEPLVSGGKVVRNDDGQPLAIRRYSDSLIFAPPGWPLSLN